MHRGRNRTLSQAVELVTSSMADKILDPLSIVSLYLAGVPPQSPAVCGHSSKTQVIQNHLPQSLLRQFATLKLDPAN